MNNGAFQVNKIRRLINSQGKIFKFEKQGKNEFGEPNGKTEKIEIRGVLHETSSFISKSTGESGTIRKKTSPMVLTLWESLKGLDSDNVSVVINGSTYNVNDITDISEAHLIADISLEEVHS